MISRLSIYVAKPAERHWRGAMQVLSYAKGTRNYGISYSGLEKRRQIEGYVDSDYAGDRTGRKSTYGSIFMFLRA
jgi:hypothetical protein